MGTFLFLPLFLYQTKNELHSHRSETIGRFLAAFKVEAGCLCFQFLSDVVNMRINQLVLVIALVF